MMYEAWGVSRVQAAGVGRALATRRSLLVGYICRGKLHNMDGQGGRGTL